MRAPNKSRSRNKNNRRNNNGGGNVLNRVYDSAGPDGRVRGTPVQVIEKYQALAHDHALAGDRVAMENFQQHAEHYIRLINEAQRQMAERREQNQNQNQGQNQNQNRGGEEGSKQPQPETAPAQSAPAANAGGPQPSVDFGSPAEVVAASAAAAASAMPVLGTPGDEEQPDIGLVETPESETAKAAPKPKPKRQRRPKVAKEPAEEEARPQE